MIQHINALKCKNGWHVTKTETEHLQTESDVIKYMRQNNVKFKEEFSTSIKMYGC